MRASAASLACFGPAQPRTKQPIHPWSFPPRSAYHAAAQPAISGSGLSQTRPLRVAVTDRARLSCRDGWACWGGGRARVAGISKYGQDSHRPKPTQGNQDPCLSRHSAPRRQPCQYGWHQTDTLIAIRARGNRCPGGVRSYLREGDGRERARREGRMGLGVSWVPDMPSSCPAVALQMCIARG